MRPSSSRGNSMLLTIAPTPGGGVSVEDHHARKVVAVADLAGMRPDIAIVVEVQRNFAATSSERDGEVRGDGTCLRRAGGALEGKQGNECRRHGVENVHREWKLQRSDGEDDTDDHADPPGRRLELPEPHEIGVGLLRWRQIRVDGLRRCCSGLTELGCRAHDSFVPLAHEEPGHQRAEGQPADDHDDAEHNWRQAKGWRIHRYLTCQCLMPLIMLCRRRSGAETGVSWGMWSAIALNIRSMVIRARLAPTQ